MTLSDFVDGGVERHLRHLKSGEMTDFTIRLRGKEWKVHGIVLSKVSNFFSKACVGQFQEATTRVIELHDDDIRMLGRLVLFCYVGQYPSPGAQKSLQPELEELVGLSDDDEDGDLTVHAAMYGMGDKYDIPALKKLSKDNYLHTLENSRYSANDFFQSTLVVFTTTTEADEEFRKWVVWEAQKRSVLLSCYSEFKDVLTKVPEFAHDLVTKYARGSFTWCKKCKKRDVMELRKFCICGFSSLCGLSEYCRNPQSLLDNIACTFCGKTYYVELGDPALLLSADPGTMDAFWST